MRENFLEHGSFVSLLANLPEPVRDLVEFEYLSGWRQGAAKKLEWKDIDLRAWVTYLRIGNSKNKEAWTLPLTGRLREIIERRMDNRRLDCHYIFHRRNGRQIKDFRSSWATACKKVGLVGGRAGVIPHDLRRCAARNLSRAGVREQVAMRITGHKTASMYRRYRIVDERDLKEATESLQQYLETQSQNCGVVPIKKASGD